ncbi:DUF1345 domain-containing protein [Psychrobacter urativorans]|uniref:DUF1345 domain-containing protein n=1 Tax=Psychrobacter urativorans TaxID=45610 RepID=A0A0M4TVX8_9GAMM|nr:DUF1345 domain-containing protein [Psychrobacter urativorans]ALF60199.1 hypothetical protein AOC03_09250 [Psychrobacter urativorans]
MIVRLNNYLQHHWLISHWRLIGSLIGGAIIGTIIAIIWAVSFSTSFIIGWDSAILIYIVSIVVMMRKNTIHDHLIQVHEGKVIILTLIMMASLICLLAIVRQTQIGKDYQGMERIFTPVLTVSTIFINWLMIQIIFALQYGYLYFAEQRQDALLPFMFPESMAAVNNPSDTTAMTVDAKFEDFFYCAVAIGTSGQTADIAFTSKAGRGLATLHSIIAFVFNLVIISLLINIIASYI